MWILIIIAVHINNPSDIPGRVSLKFATEKECQQALATIDSWIKFNSFRIEGKCQKQS